MSGAHRRLRPGSLYLRYHLRDNLRLARPQASDAQLADVADRARLLGWFTSLPRGWDTLDVLTIHRRSRAKVYAFLLVDQGWWQMAEFDGSRSLGINADVLWAVVADPARLADWVPTMRLAQPAGKEEVHVEGESHGHRYSLDSLLRIDERERRLHWGAEGDDSYRGSLRVTEQPSGSEVHLHVTIPDDHLGPSPDSANAEIRRGIEETFDRLAGLIAT